MIKPPYIKLNDGNSIPQVGLGLWQVKDEADFMSSFNSAVDAGYRHFDTAQVYGNEIMLGKALESSGLKRKDVFITTKIGVQNFGAGRTKKSFKKSLEELNTDYVDLLLLHFPVSILRKKSWPVLEQLKIEGKAKSIGVSNYTIRHLEEMEKYSNIIPAINQVELHVFLQQKDLRDYCATKGIAIEAYSPLAHAKDFDEPVIKQIAKKHNKSYAQIMLRWCIENDIIVIPKSVTPKRVQENINIFDFSLDEEDILKLNKLDRGLRTCWNPTLVP
jgi:diketogulonate reductase-like aldo/keto reductase